MQQKIIYINLFHNLWIKLDFKMNLEKQLQCMLHKRIITKFTN